VDLEKYQILAFDIRNASLRLALVDLATENVLFPENIPLFFSRGGIHKWSDTFY
jgi:hypothetical protein